ncbi:MAG: YqaE/Pmp3 family membrane protein [Flavobacteriaceae bacterium]|nr:YqaE/Pmp3 family membrane protein [Flavobacteriaceae bacterium]
MFTCSICYTFPPLSVFDKGCGSIIIVFLLTLAGWVPGVIATLIILNKKNIDARNYIKRSGF